MPTGKRGSASSENKALKDAPGEDAQAALTELTAREPAAASLHTEDGSLFNMPAFSYI